MGVEWILWPVIWSIMIGGVIIHNENAEKEKLAEPQPEIHYDHGDKD